jgi:hypothetical protein
MNQDGPGVLEMPWAPLVHIQNIDIEILIYHPSTVRRKPKA